MPYLTMNNWELKMKDDPNLFTCLWVNAEWRLEQVIQSFGDVDVQSRVCVLKMWNKIQQGKLFRVVNYFLIKQEKAIKIIYKPEAWFRWECWQRFLCFCCSAWRTRWCACSSCSSAPRNHLSRTCPTQSCCATHRRESR